jgi:hypothetical protein
MIARELAMTKNFELRPVEIAILAIVRAAAATTSQLGDFFPELDHNQLNTILEGLCGRGLLLRDACGVFWITDLAVELLTANCVIAWISKESTVRWPWC